MQNEEAKCNVLSLCGCKAKNCEKWFKGTDDGADDGKDKMMALRR